MPDAPIWASHRPAPKQGALSWLSGLIGLRRKPRASYSRNTRATARFTRRVVPSSEDDDGLARRNSSMIGWLRRSAGERAIEEHQKTNAFSETLQSRARYMIRETYDDTLSPTRRRVKRVDAYKPTELGGGRPVFIDTVVNDWRLPKPWAERGDTPEGDTPPSSQVDGNAPADAGGAARRQVAWGS